MNDFLSKVSNFGNQSKNANFDVIEKYIHLPQCSSDINPVEWWKLNANSYPVLSKIARDYLAGQATSVPVEEVFSSGSDVVSPDRNRLNSLTITQCMCLKYWSK